MNITTLYMGRNIDNSDSWRGWGSSLDNLTIGEKVTVLRNLGAYTGTDFHVPAGIKRIEGHTFFRCPNLKNVYLNEGLEYIGEDAFTTRNSATRDPEAIESIHIPSIEAWLNIGFGGTQFKYTSPWTGVCPTKLYVGGELLTDLVVPESIVNIWDSAFAGYGYMNSVTFHDGVKRIGHYAFQGCHIESSLELPRNLDMIGYEAFSASFTTLPEEIAAKEYIAQNAFCYNNAAPSGRLRVNTPSIGGLAFNKVSGLTEVVIGPEVEEVGSRAFFNVDRQDAESTVKKVVIEDADPDKPLSISEDAFVEDNDYFHVKEIYMGRSYSGRPFYNCVELTDLTIGDRVKTINTGNFYLALSLKSLVIPASVETIGDSFYRAPLESVVFKDSETPVKVGAIADVPYYETRKSLASIYVGRPLDFATSLEKTQMLGYNAAIVTLGRGIKEVTVPIGPYTGQIRCQTYNPPTFSDRALPEENQRRAEVHVLEGRWRAYRTAEIWKDFIQEIVDDIPWNKPEALAVSETALDGMMNLSQRLRVEVTPADAPADMDWVSSNPEVASVEADGTVNYVSEGQCVITGTSQANPELSVQCAVNVNYSYIKGIDLEALTSNDVDEVYPGQVFIAPYLIQPYYAANKQIEWSVSNPAIAKIKSVDGKLEKKDGYVEIEALSPGEFELVGATTDGSGIVIRKKIRVIIPVTKIEVVDMPSTFYVHPGQRFKLEANVYPENADYRNYRWVAHGIDVEDDGTLVVNSFGEFYLYAETLYKDPDNYGLGNYCVSEHINVVSLSDYEDVTSVNVDGDSGDSELVYAVEAGKSIELEITMTPLIKSPYTVEVADPEVVSAEKTASNYQHIVKVTGLQPGETRLRIAAADVSRHSRYIRLIVLDGAPVAPRSISILPHPCDHQMYVGETISLSSQTSPSEAVQISEWGWTGSSDAAVDVDAEGNVTALAVGEGSVVAKVPAGNMTETDILGNKKRIIGYYALNIYNRPDENVVLILPYDVVTPGFVMQATATLPAAAEGRVISWKTSDTSIATVDGTGLITAGNKTGSVWVYADAGDGFRDYRLLKVDKASEIADAASAEPEIAFDGSRIYVNGLPEGSTVRLFMLNGLQVAVAESHGGTAVLSAAPGSSYILSDGRHSLKIAFP